MYRVVFGVKCVEKNKFSYTGYDFFLEGFLFLINKNVFTPPIACLLEDKFFSMEN